LSQLAPLAAQRLMLIIFQICVPFMQVYNYGSTWNRLRCDHSTGANPFATWPNAFPESRGRHATKRLHSLAADVGWRVAISET